jgi:predicted N-acetyltransferase YhbS
MLAAMAVLPRLTVKNAGPGTLAILTGLWHRVWYGHVTPESHHAYRMRMLTSPWARRHIQVLALEEGGAVRSGMIVLSHTMRLRGKKVKVAGVAAVVTDPDHRGRGFANRLIAIAHRRFVDSGHDAAMLFTEIGTAYYAKLGYITWPVVKHLLELPAPERARGLKIAPATAADLPDQARLYAAVQDRYDLALVRPRPLWRHVIARSRWRDEVLEPVDGTTVAHDPHRWIARTARGVAVAYARAVPREDDLWVAEAGYAPGHAPALAQLLAHRGRALDRAKLALAASPRLVEELGLPAIKSETIEKMMFAPLGGKTPAPADVAPATHCFWPEDWF